MGALGARARVFHAIGDKAMIGQFVSNFAAMMNGQTAAQTAGKGATQAQVNQQAALGGGSYVVADRVTRSKQRERSRKAIGNFSAKKPMLDGLKKVGGKKKA